MRDRKLELFALMNSLRDIKQMKKEIGDQLYNKKQRKRKKISYGKFDN